MWRMPIVLNHTMPKDPNGFTLCSSELNWTLQAPWTSAGPWSNFGRGACRCTLARPARPEKDLPVSARAPWAQKHGRLSKPEKRLRKHPVSNLQRNKWAPSWQFSITHPWNYRKVSDKIIKYNHKVKWHQNHTTSHHRWEMAIFFCLSH